MLVQCEICDEIIAKTKPDRLRLPFDTSMFDPPTPEHTNPWPWLITWLDMRCPHCNMRPFVMTEKEIQDALEGRTEGPIRLKTPRGWFKLGDKYEPGENPPREAPIYEDDELEKEWAKRMFDSEAVVTIATVKDGQYKEAQVKTKDLHVDNKPEGWVGVTLKGEPKHFEVAPEAPEKKARKGWPKGKPRKAKT